MSVEHEIYYSNKGRIPIKTVIKGLLAAETLINELTPAIRAVFSEVDIKEVNVYLEKLESGSIREDLTLDLVFGGEEEYQKFRKKLRRMRGNTNDDEPADNLIMKQLIALLFVGALASGVTWALSPETPVPQSIQNYTTNITNSVIGSGDGALSGQQIVDIVSSQTDKKKIAQAAVNFIAPAKLDPDATISINDNDTLTVTNDFVKEAPETYTAPTQEEQITTYSNAPVFIVASDSRRRGTGWTGILNGIIDGPTKLTLADDVDPSKLHGNLNIKADISVIKKYNASKKDFEIKEVLIKDWTM